MNPPIDLSVVADAELVLRSRRGERAAFGQLVSRHQAAVCGVAYAVCGDFAASEDLAQDAFVASWDQLAELADPVRFRPWVCGIGRMLALSHVRRRSRRGDRPPADTTAAAPEHVAADAPSPREQAIGAEERALLWRSLDALPENYREPLVLFYREQQSITAVAAALELSEDTVKQRLSRGRVLLRDEVAQTLAGVLFRTRPSPTFAAAVLAALPPAVVIGGSLATAGTAKAASAAGATSTGAGPVTGAAVLPAATLVSALVGVAGIWIGWLAWQRGRRLRRAGVVETIRWESRARFLGLPWISLACGSDPARGQTPAVARGWLAVGDRAYGGCCAVGGIAVAPFAVGGLAFGVVSLGGLAAGLLALGGIGLGHVAVAGAAFGSGFALGGVAVSINVACGGLAVAGRLALGGLAHAPRVGAEAWPLVQADPLARVGLAAAPHLGWLSLLAVPFLLFALRRLRAAPEKPIGRS